MGEQSCTDRCIAKYLEVRSSLNVYTTKENYDENLTNNDTDTGIEFDSREISTNSNATDATSTATATTTVK